MNKHFSNIKAFFIVAICAVLLFFSPLDSAENVTTPKLNAPGELADIKDQNKHFPYLLENIPKNPKYYGYLKIRYFFFPTARQGVFPELKPSPKEGLIAIQNELDILAPIVFIEKQQPRKSINQNVSKELIINHQADKDDIIRWFYLKGSLAWAKRFVNRIGDDGGVEYSNIFSYPEFLKSEPELFNLLAKDFVQIAGRPLMSNKANRIKDGYNTSLNMIMAYLTLPENLQSEPRFSDLLNDRVIYPKDIEIVVKKIASQNHVEENFNILHRIAKLLGQSFYFSNKKKIYAMPEDTVKYLQKCLGHSKFQGLDSREQTEMQELLFEAIKTTGKPEEVITYQTKLIDSNKAGYYPLFSFYQEQINQIDKEINNALKILKDKEKYKANPKVMKDIENINFQIKSAKQKKMEYTTKSQRALDIIMSFKYMPDVTPTAKLLYELGRKWEAYKYLNKYIQEAKSKDVYSVNVAINLSTLYLIEAIQRTKGKIGAVLPPLRDGEKEDSSERKRWAKNDLKADYYQKALGILDKINFEEYKESDKKFIKGSVYRCNILKNRIITEKKKAEEIDKKKTAVSDNK